MSFEHGAVMTSPVLVGDEILYVTSMGLLRRRSRIDGKLLGTVTLPAGSVMASPVLVGDTLILAIDGDGVCSVSLSTNQLLWCRRLVGLQDVGDVAPTILSDNVIVSGDLPLTFQNWRMLFLKSNWKTRIARTLGLITGSMPSVGQRFEALSLRDGHTVWSSQTFLVRRRVIGHPSGTAVAVDKGAVIVLPWADTVVAFDPTTGRTAWSAPGFGSRGPPLISRGNILMTGHDGVLHVLDAMSGREKCSQKLGASFDRAGPIIIGRTLVAADGDGLVTALPLSQLDACENKIAVHR
jgi:outer membrane protein assembly factor BamB